MRKRIQSTKRRQVEFLRIKNTVFETLIYLILLYIRCCRRKNTKNRDNNYNQTKVQRKKEK